jgi:hypothetical protein
MGIKNLFSGLKDKAQDITMEKALERMRDLKQPISESKIKKLLATHVETIEGIKSAKVSISHEGFTVKVSYSDGRPATKRTLFFEELVWTSHKRSLVLRPDESYDVTKDHGTYACIVTLLAAVLREMLGMTQKNVKTVEFSTEIGVISGVIEKEGKHYYDFRRVPLLRQYVHYRIHGHAPIDHLNVTDCWCENGKVVVRIDNNKIVDQIKNLNLDPAQLRNMMKGDMSDIKM